MPLHYSICCTKATVRSIGGLLFVPVNVNPKYTGKIAILV